MAETSTKPYLIRALYEWCCDNGYTPYLAVVVDKHTRVPRQHVRNGEIVLNVSPMATNQMAMGNELIEFQARFSGVAQQLSIPVDNVAAIYARETGHGMAFEVARPATEASGDGDAVADASEASEASAAPADAGQDAAQQADEPGRKGPAAGRKRGGKGQGGADVIAFSAGGGRGRESSAGEGPSGKAPAGRQLSSNGAGASSPSESQVATDRPEPLEAATAKQREGRENGEGEARHPGQPGTGADEPVPSDDHDEPPPSGGRKGGRTRLTRVK